MRLIAPLLVLWVVSAAAMAASDENRSERPTIALVGGRVLTQTDDGAVTGTVLIRDGKIAAIGRDVKLPENVRQIARLVDGFHANLVALLNPTTP